MKTKIERYVVYTYSWASHPTRKGKTSEVVVSNAPESVLSESEGTERFDLVIARFPIGPKYSEEHQVSMAFALRDTLNAQVDAMNQAVEYNTTLQVLKI